jgi:protein MpaA
MLAAVLAATALAAVPVHRETIGRSVDGRAIRAVAVGEPDAKTKVLVVGCIHGNEGAGIPIARRLERMAPPSGVQLWIVEDANPDGHAAGTRQNAHGVDLNRNWTVGWRRHRGGLFDSGPRPLSEPETRAAQRLILRIRPDVSIWYHQHLNLVDESGGEVSVERRYAQLVGLPARRLLPLLPGTAVRWENARIRGSTAFVVELPAGRLSAAAVARYARAVRAISVD